MRSPRDVCRNLPQLGKEHETHIQAFGHALRGQDKISLMPEDTVIVSLRIHAGLDDELVIVHDHEVQTRGSVRSLRPRPNARWRDLLVPDSYPERPLACL